MSLSISDGIRKSGTKLNKLGRLSSNANNGADKGAAGENQPPQMKSLKIATG